MSIVARWQQVKYYGSCSSFLDAYFKMVIYAMFFCNLLVHTIAHW